MIDLSFSFEAEVWRYSGQSAWYFVTIPYHIASEIKFFRKKHMGFGTIRVTVNVGSASWKTSIFPDKKSDSYLLPIKADVRKTENIIAGKNITVKINLLF